MVLVGRSGLTRVSNGIAMLRNEKVSNVRQRLREWYWEKAAKSGSQRQELEVRTCFGSLLRWILSWWSGEEQRLVLVLDACTLKARFVVLAISVVYRSCAIPVAWKVQAADQQGNWKSEWLEMLALLQDSVPEEWCVLVLADRGLYAPWLFQAIRQCGWHPFLRIKQEGLYRPAGSQSYQNLAKLVTRPGQHWAGQVTCFKTRPIRATLLASWSPKYQEPWLVLTDLPPKQAHSAWYAMRSWIECGFKHTKRAGWHWHNTRMADPNRAQRFWLAIAVATLWVVAVGGQTEVDHPASNLHSTTDSSNPSAKSKSQSRSLSCFRIGINRLLTSWISQLSIPPPRFFPQPWPT